MNRRGTSMKLTSIALALTSCLLLGAGCGQGSTSYKNPTRAPGAPIGPDKQVTMDDLLYWTVLELIGR